MQRALCIFIGLVFGVLVTSSSVMMIRTFQLARMPVAEPSEPIAVDALSVASHLADAIAFRTIAAQGDSEAAFLGLDDFLTRTYKLAHERLARQRMGNHSLLY